MVSSQTQFNMAIVFEDTQEQFRNDFAAQVMAKCTKACFLSLKESKLLPTEERCLRNCFVKSGDFNTHFTHELNYALRNLDKYQY